MQESMAGRLTTVQRTATATSRGRLARRTLSPSCRATRARGRRGGRQPGARDRQRGGAGGEGGGAVRDRQRGGAGGEGGGAVGDSGGTCILLRTAPIWTDMALGGTQATRVTRPKRSADMGSSGAAMLKSQPGISGDSRSDLRHRGALIRQNTRGRWGRGRLQEEEEGRTARFDLLLEPLDFGGEAAGDYLACCDVRDQIAAERCHRGASNGERQSNEKLPIGHHIMK